MQERADPFPSVDLNLPKSVQMKSCLIGKTLKHSYSKIIHEHFGYEYDLVELEKEDINSQFTQISDSGASWWMSSTICEKIEQASEEVWESPSVNI